MPRFHADIPTRSRLTAAEPQLFVTSLANACAFYTDKLGFTVAFTYGDPPHYAQVVRDAARLNLRVVPVPIIGKQCRAGEDLLTATITLDDAAPLYHEFLAANADFHQPLRTAPWGAETFIVRDPDGNLILFAGRAAS
jgi:catechol 2,3-dioxygenase-like lactoylglutathione lyase family enzyme